MKKILSVLWLVAAGLTVWAAENEPTPEEIHKNLTGKGGHIDLPGNLAALDLKPGYTYLDPAQTKFLLERFWKNPEGDGYLGTILSPGFFDQNLGAGWAAIISYQDSGHVKDDDAAGLNYDDLLKQLKDSANESNKERKEKGMPEVTLIGWATQPHYDQQAKNLYWARELSFTGNSTHTLNYAVRLLGRQGVLELNVVADIEDLKKVEADTPALLTQAKFIPGQTYADYQEGSDHLAEFGVAGLILGGIALKAGLLKVIIGFLAASWKFILAGFLALGAFFARFFKNRKKKALSAPANPAPTEAGESPDPVPQPSEGSTPVEPKDQTKTAEDGKKEA